MNEKKSYQVLLECYRELYRAAEPPANFDDLVANAETVEQLGRKVKQIPMDDHCISNDRMDEIIAGVCKRHKLNPYWSSKVSQAVYLGCSPRIF